MNGACTCAAYVCAFLRGDGEDHMSVFLLQMSVYVCSYMIPTDVFGKIQCCFERQRYKMFIRNMLFPVYSATKGLVIVYLIFSQCKHKKAWH